MHELQSCVPEEVRAELLEPEEHVLPGRRRDGRGVLREDRLHRVALELVCHFPGPRLRAALKL